MIQSLSRGIEILMFLAESGSAGCTEVAVKLNVNKSTAFRLMETLRAYDFVEQDAETSKYKLGAAILHLREKLLSNFDLVDVAKPYLVRLTEATRESAHLCVLSNGKAVILDRIMNKAVIKVYAAIGVAEPFHCSSVGKCLLAFQSDSLRERILKNVKLRPFTPRTITTLDALYAELEAIRQKGYAVDDEEVNAGVRCIAAPIRNYKGTISSCLGISGPSSRITPASLSKYADAVRGYAEKISFRRGYRA